MMASQFRPWRLLEEDWGQSGAMRNQLRRLFVGDSERRSRLHTRRGTRVGTGEFAAAAVRRAMGREGRDVPWIAPAALGRLEELLQPHWTLLELGSGASTLWLAQRVASVVSIEDNPEWAARVRTLLRSAGATNVRLLTCTARELAGAPELAEGYDAVFIDFTEQADWGRVDALRAVRGESRLRLVILDDSDRSRYAEADDLMKGWTAERYVGIRPRPLIATETTLFRR